MKATHIFLMILLTAQAGFAKLSCTTDDRKLEVDTAHKRVVLTVDGKPHRFRIISPANHGFQLFGRTSEAYEVEGGLMVGIKDTKDSTRKDLSVFRRGEAIASFSDCELK